MNHLQRAGRWARNPMALTTLAAAIAAAVIVTVREDAAAQKPAGTAAAPALTVEATRVSVASWSNVIQATGLIAPREEVSVAAEVGNVRIVGVHVDVGDSVLKGQRIADLDDVELRSQEAELAAEVARAGAQWRNARSQLDRGLRLEGEAALSEQDLEQLRASEEASRAAAEGADARLESKRLQIRRTRIVAPCDGVVSARSALLGVVTSPGQPLFRVLRDNLLEWRAELTAAQLSQVQASQRVDFLLPDGSTAAGRVRQLAPTVDPASRLGLAYVDVDPGTPWRAGMYALGHVNVGSAEALVLPASALVVRDGRTSVAQLRLVEGAHRVSMTPVTVGRRQGDSIEVVEGLRPGDEVVLSGAGLLGDGDAVRVVSAAWPASDALPGGRQ